LAIQTQEGALFWDIVGLQVRLDRRHCTAQFLSVLSVTWIAESGKPLVRVRLQDGGTRTTSPGYRPV
jgi:hypothetical protein